MSNRNHTPVVLNVAEKPSVARALASVFGRMGQDRGRRQGVHTVFQHDNVCFPNIFSQNNKLMNAQVTPHSMITTSVRGHLARIDFPKQYGWNQCDPLVLLETNTPIETSYTDDMNALAQSLRRIRCDALVLWLDCDREGEAIAAEVREALDCQVVLRARFSTVLPQEIERALNRLDFVRESWVDAVQARSELDLRVGAAFTRMQTVRLQRNFVVPEGVISYGPCQFPTLGFVVERWARIETFVPDDYWYLDLSIKHPEQPNGRTIQFSWLRQRLYDRVATLVLYQTCLESSQAIVNDLSGRSKNKWRPVPLATVELQKRASRYLRIGSESLMSIAEDLYQQGLISYPRTETEKFRPEFGHQSLIEQLASIPGDLGEYASRLLTHGKFQTPRAGQHDDQAHPPITPCKAVDPEVALSNPQQRAVYVLVVKHYLACCSQDAKGKETKITLRISSESFTATGLMVLERNWLEVYSPYERWSTGQGELPALQIGSRVPLSSFTMKTGRTAPPQPLTEVELITLMDKNGIGTDATIAQHIATVQDRGYARKDTADRFSPTKLGIALVEGYNSMGYQLNKPELRRETESECNLIAAGQKSKLEVVEATLEKMRQCFRTAIQEAHKLDQAMVRYFQRLGGQSDNSTRVLKHDFSQCGVCQRSMALKQQRADGARGGTQQRRLLFCVDCSMGYLLPRGALIAKVNGDQTPVKCPICNFQVIRVERGEGYDGNGYHVCPKCFSDPPLEHGGTTNGIDFRCFMCTNQSCSLSGSIPGGNVPVFSCPFCRGSNDAVIRKNSKGFVLSCNKQAAAGRDRCGYTIWLPKSCINVSIMEDENNPEATCARCSRGPNSVVRKLRFEWKRGCVPSHIGPSTVCCILCDEGFRQEFQIVLPKMNQVTARRPRTAPRRNASGQPGRNPVCYKCHQPGHFASACTRS